MSKAQPDAGMAVRAGVAVLCLLVLFWVRWDGSLDHFDFQVWRAADAIVDAGGDPYDAEGLNRELRAKPDIYGKHWVREGFEEREMFFLNPPVWLAELRLFGFSPFVMSLAGAAVGYASIVLLSRTRTTRDALGHLGAATYVFVLGQGVSTFRLGQVGLLVTGLVGAQLVLVGRRTEGVPGALLAFKPHIAVAALIPGLFRRGLRGSTRLVAPVLALLVTTVVLFPVSLWGSWLRALRHPDRPEGRDDMSLRTLSTMWPIPSSLGTITLAAALVAVAVMCRRWHRADPKLLTLSSLAVTILLSGYSYAHDWLWIALIPAVCAWRMIPSLVAGIAIGSLFTVGDAIAGTGEPVVLSLKSLIAVAATLYLVWAARRSHRSEPVATADAEPAAVAAA